MAMTREKAARIIGRAMEGARPKGLSEALRIYGLSGETLDQFRSHALSAMSPSREHLCGDEREVLALHGLDSDFSDDVA